MEKNGQTTEQLLAAELNGGSANQNPTGGDQPSSATNGQPAATVDAQYVTLPGHVDSAGNPIKMTPEQAAEKYKELQATYTQTSQELSQLKKNPPQPQSAGQDNQPPVNQGSQPAIDPGTNLPLSPKDQVLQSELKRLGVAFKSEVPDENKIVERASSVSLSNITLRNALEELSSSFDGGEEEVNGVKVMKPQVDPTAVLDFIKANPNTDRTPTQIARYLYADDFIKYETQKAIAGTSGGSSVPSTEGAGSGNQGVQPNPAPFNFRDGSTERGVADILRNG